MCQRYWFGISVPFLHRPLVTFQAKFIKKKHPEVLLLEMKWQWFVILYEKDGDDFRRGVSWLFWHMLQGTVRKISSLIFLHPTSLPRVRNTLIWYRWNTAFFVMICNYDILINRWQCRYQKHMKYIFREREREERSGWAYGDREISCCLSLLPWSISGIYLTQNLL